MPGHDQTSFSHSQFKFFSMRQENVIAMNFKSFVCGILLGLHKIHNFLFCTFCQQSKPTLNSKPVFAVWSAVAELALMAHWKSTVVNTQNLHYWTAMNVHVATFIVWWKMFLLRCVRHTTNSFAQVLAHLTDFCKMQQNCLCMVCCHPVVCGQWEILLSQEILMHPFIAHCSAQLGGWRRFHCGGSVTKSAKISQWELFISTTKKGLEIASKTPMGFFFGQFHKTVLWQFFWNVASRAHHCNQALCSLHAHWNLCSLVCFSFTLFHSVHGVRHALQQDSKAQHGIWFIVMDSRRQFPIHPVTRKLIGKASNKQCSRSTKIIVYGFCPNEPMM